MMQRVLATSAVIFSLGVTSAGNPSVAHRLASLTVASSDHDEMRRSDQNSLGQGCFDTTGQLIPHGTVFPAADQDPCAEYTCLNGQWLPTVSASCRRDNLLGAAPVQPAHGGSASPDPSLPCPLPTFKSDGTWVCPDQSLSLDERRNLFESMKPYDEINGVKLDDFWPATAGETFPIADNYQYDYEGIDFVGYRLSRPTGERAPIHYHEVAQLLCLEKGRIMVMTDGEEDKFYSAPDCYMMPAYTKVSVISLETKVENCLLRVPKGGLDWVVIEPKYYELQGQWEANL